MSLRNPLAGVPLRAARWSALHPWRAILGWLVFVLVAVGLAVAIPTQEPTDADYRLGESGRADAMVQEGGLESPDHRERPDHRPRGRRARRSRPPSRRPPTSRRDMAAVDGVEQVSQPQWSPDRSALLLEIQLAKDREDVQPLVDVTDAVQEEHAGPRPPPGRRHHHRRQHRRTGRRGPVGRRGHQHPGHPGADAAGVRRADRRRHPGPAGRDQCRGDHGDHGAAVLPGALRAHGRQHDRADRHGGRRRLLALLPQAGTRGTGQGPHHPRRGGDRGRDVRSLDPGVRRRGDRVDGRPVRHRRRDVQLARHRRDRRRRGRRPRLDHGAAGPAGQARSLGRPAAGPAAVAAEPPDRPGRHQPPRARSRDPATRWSPSSRRAWSWACWRCRRSA